MSCTPENGVLGEPKSSSKEKPNRKHPNNSRAQPCLVCERILPLTFYSSRPVGDKFAMPLVTVCLTCEKLSSPKQTRTNPLIPEKPFSCGSCEKVFRYKAKLIEHERTHSGEKPFPCPDCDKSFISRQRLRLHSTVHTGEKRYGCAECGKRFRLSQSLNIHRRIHTGETPYECGECGKRFKALPSLYSHRKIHNK